MKEGLIKLATFLAGLYFVVEFLIPGSWSEAWGIDALNEPISNGFVAIGSMAFGLGLINLIRIHGKTILFLNHRWFYSLALLLGLFSMITFASMDWIANLRLTKASDKILLLSTFSEKIISDVDAKTEGVLDPKSRTNFLIEGWQKEKKSFSPEVMNVLKENPSFQKIEELSGKLINSDYNPDLLKEISPLFAEVSTLYRAVASKNYESSGIKFGYNLLNNGIFVPLGAAMFSLLGFYIAGAAYRAFHVRSFEAFLMMAAAVLVICGQTTFTLSIFTGFSDIRAWLLQVPNSAAFRAITIGAGVAGLVLAFRMWFSVESGVFGRKK